MDSRDGKFKGTDVLILPSWKNSSRRQEEVHAREAAPEVTSGRDERMVMRSDSCIRDLDRL